MQPTRWGGGRGEIHMIAGQSLQVGSVMRNGPGMP